MNSDNYDLAKSMLPQGVDKYSPYVSKQWNSINDINSGVYQNNGLSLVQFDLSTIYNSTSESFSNTEDLVIALPIVMGYSVNLAGDGASQALTNMNASALLALKSGYQHLIHQGEIVMNGKVVSEQQPFVSVFNNFKLLSTMSASELKSISQTLGMSECLDNPESAQFWTRPQTLPTVATGTTNTNTAQPGVGLCNNLPFGTSGSGSGFQSSLGVKQNAGVVNEAISRRLSRIVETTGSAKSVNNLYGSATSTFQPTIMSAQQLQQEFKPMFAITGNIGYYYDVAILPLKYLFDVCDKVGLTKKLDMLIRLYVNTGSIQIPVTGGDGTPQYGIPLNSSFSNTCPFTVNLLPAPSATGGLPGLSAAAPLVITAGCWVSKPPSQNWSVGGASISLSAIPSHPMPAARCYYALTSLETSMAIKYLEENRSKQVVFENLLYNQFNAVGAGSSFSTLVQSGIQNPLGVLIVPYISSTCPIAVGSSSSLGLAQWASPYDTAPATSSPCSLTNLQVTLGGKNQLETTMFYTFEDFLQQISPYQSAMSDMGFNSGLISQKHWESNRMYFVDLTRGRDADRLTPRNLQISCNNNTNIPLDIMVFSIYHSSIQVDVATGSITRV